MAAYLVVETLSNEQLKLWQSVIIDAVSPVMEARDMCRGLSNKHHSRLVVIECVLESELHKKRIESRIRNMNGIPEVTWDDVENRRKEYLEWKEKILVLNTSDNWVNNVNTVLEYIKALEKEQI